MAITYTDNGGGAPNGSDLEFTYTFPVIQTEDVKVALDGVTQATTKYAVDTASNPTKITFNNTSVDSSVQESTGAPKSGVRVRVYRETTVGKSTGDDDPKAVFAAGSSIRATDLNANVEQALYAIHELQNRPIETEDIQDLAVTSDKIKDGTIVNADVNDSAAIAGTKISPDFGSQNIATTGTINSLTTTELAILDGATVSTAELNILDGATVTTAELNSLDGFTGNVSELNTLDGVTASTAEINKLDGVTASTAELNILDGVTATATELNLIDGVTATTAELNYVDGVTSNIQTQLDNKQPLDAELTELATMSSTTASSLADLTQAEVQILDGATVSTTELNKLDGVTATTAELNILDGVTATATELNLNDGQTATPTEVNILDGATVSTTELNKLDGYTGTAADLNEVVTGKSVVEQISPTATDAQIPTAQAVNERITTVVSDVGGFVPIANETSFPTANPDLDDAAGTIVSIKALDSAFTTGSGVTTHTFTNGAGSGNNVTITGLTQSTTYPAGRGMLLETTPTSGNGSATPPRAYAFHRLTLDETGVAAAQAAIDDWDERYYGPINSPPSTRPGGGSRVQGDLYFSTADNQMKVWNNAASQWDDVASSASSNIVTLTPAFNNSETEFTCSTVPVDAQSLLLSINGVIQKPNSGTSTPSEGYVKLANGKIKLATAPASGADYFAIALGNTVSVGTPSPNTVGATELKTGEIANTHVSSSAAIAGSKISPSFTSDITITNSAPSIALVDSDSNSDFSIFGSQGEFRIRDQSNTTNRLTIASDGTTTIAGNTDFSAGIDVTGNITVTGTVDGVDVAALSTSNAAKMPLTGGTFTGNVTTQKILPVNDSQFDIGENATRFANVYADTLYGDGSNLTGINTDLVSDTSPQLGGTLDVNGQVISFGDSSSLDDRLTFGAGTNGDLRIYHNGTDSFIENQTGYLYVDSGASAIRLISDGSWANGKMAAFYRNGSVELYYDNSKKFETYSTGAYVYGHLYTDDNNQHRFGNDGDLQIYHDGSHSWLKNSTGNFYINPKGAEVGIALVPDGKVELRYDDAKKLETTSTGVEVVGRYAFDANNYITCNTTANTMEFVAGGQQVGEFNSTAFTFLDNKECRFGTGNDLRIFHDGSNNYIKGTQNQLIYIATNNVNRWYFANDGHFRPEADNSYDIGSASQRVRNIYTGDLNLSNEGSSNDVDGTWGSYTIQEGESDLFLKNNRSGKKYKFNLTEVS